MLPPHAEHAVNHGMPLAAGRDGPIAAAFEAELAGVEARLTAELTSDLGCVNALVRHSEQYHGKMLRPTLVFVTAMATARDGEPITERHRVAATVVEMIHMATLVHDDVLDEAVVRRGGPALNHLCGNEAAVMLGDFLLSHAYHLSCRLVDTPVLEMLAQTTNRVCEGELLQLANRGNWQLDERTYFEIIRRKTASLCGACCRVAAALHDADDATCAMFGRYGEKLGLAFQVIDDLLDLTGSEQTVGKTLRRDLQSAKPTLPIIHHLQTVGADDRRLLQRIDSLSPAAGPGDEDQAVQSIAALLDETDSIAYAARYAHRLTDEAISDIGRLPDTPAKAIMADIAAALVSRQA